MRVCPCDYVCVLQTLVKRNSPLMQSSNFTVARVYCPTCDVTEFVYRLILFSLCCCVAVELHVSIHWSIIINKTFYGDHSASFQ